MGPVTLVYDDSVRVPAEIGALAGISRFGQLLYRRRTLAQRTLDAAEAAGITSTLRLASTRDVEALRDRLAQQSGGVSSYVYLPSNIVATSDPKALAMLLAKLRYADRGVRLDVSLGEAWSGVAAMRREYFVDCLDAIVEGKLPAFVASHADSLAPIDNKSGLRDLRTYPTFIDFLTSNFEARHFNSVSEQDRYTLVKHSTNKEKIRHEFEYLRGVPDHLQQYFVRPFGFEEGPDWASYRMERVLIPDMAVQWIHGSLTPTEFESFLDQVFHYVGLRPSKPSPSAASIADDLYLGKLDARMKQLESLGVFARIDTLVAGAARTGGGLASLVERYKRLYAKMRRGRSFGHLVLGHGDLCFSNILHDKNSRVMKFIDPRGAARQDDLYTDPYYDVAKLSHSILGLYDYINNGLFSIAVDGELGLELVCDARDCSAEQALFESRLAANGFDLPLTRLYEASLFLSMLPLHSESPRKLAAFALTAHRILTGLES